MREVHIRYVLIFVVFITLVTYFQTVSRTCILRQATCFEFRESIANGTAPAPFRYRVLASALESVVTAGNTDYDWLIIVDYVLHSLGTVLLYMLMWRWFRRWSTIGAALAGMLVFAMAFNFTFFVFLPTLTSLIELLLMTTLLLTLDKSRWWSLLLVILATLNRETGLLLVAMYAVYHGRGQLKHILLLAAFWAGITAALHLILGAAPHMYGLMGTLTYNLNGWLRSLMFNLPFIVLWIAMFRKVRSAPPFFQRLALLALIYAAAVLVGGAWDEIRLWMPIMVLMLPMLFMDLTPDTLTNS